jgi:chromate transporter
MTEQDHDRPAPVPFGEAVRYWLKLGFISFGGPAGQISMMHQELVERRHWISEHRFLHALNYTMVLPGPEAQQLATYIGWLMHGVKGGIVAGVLFVLPSLFILIALSWIYMRFGHLTAIAGILYGIKPAVIAIVAAAAWRIGSRTLKTRALQAIAVLSFLAIFVFDVPFPFIVIGGGIIGFLGAQFAPEYFLVEDHRHESKARYGPAVVGDRTKLPEYAEFHWPKVLLYIVLGVGIWALAMIFLASVFGREGSFTEMGWFFTKAALLTFGGAYAVLPYVYQGGVEHYAWLTGAQMIDGLALGETTPGPLIMIVAFVGFVGGWTKAVFGPDALAFAGVVGAVVATFFTFLPSFLFILIGAPLVERTRHELRLTAPLEGITAAVVGVIVNLAVFFAYHVLWPTGFSGSFEWLSLLIGIAAFIALFRYKVGVVPLIIGCATAGFLLSFVR